MMIAVIRSIIVIMQHKIVIQQHKITQNRHTATQNHTKSSYKNRWMVRFTSLKTGVLTAFKCECLPDCSRIAGLRSPSSCAGGRSRPRRRVRPRLEQRACPCGGRDGAPAAAWAAVSEAVAAGAGPDFSCAGELEQPLKALIGEVRSLSVVCVCVSGLVGKVCGRVVDLPPWSVYSRVVCAWWGSGFSWDPK